MAAGLTELYTSVNVGTWKPTHVKLTIFIRWCPWVRQKWRLRKRGFTMTSECMYGCLIYNVAWFLKECGWSLYPLNHRNFGWKETMCEEIWLAVPTLHYVNNNMCDARKSFWSAIMAWSQYEFMFQWGAVLVKLQRNLRRRKGLYFAALRADDTKKR